MRKTHGVARGLWMSLCLGLAIGLAGCQGGGEAPADSKYTVATDKLDETDRAKAKSNVEDVINAFGDVNVLVGLWSYNGPAIASALAASGKQDEILAFCFDEEEQTLQSIRDGVIRCTVVQKPFEFGYLSVKMLTEIITKKDPSKKPEDLKIAFVTNNASNFWTIAEKGINKAEAELGVTCTFRIPVDGTAAQQQEIINDLIALEFDGMAISPKDPDSMTDILNKAGEKMTLICHDSDAPKSNRVAYIGTDNYQAGRILGAEIAKLKPDGAELAIFVGTLSAQNARDRRQGVIDALNGVPGPPKPDSGDATIIDTGVSVINKDNVEEFAAELAELIK